MSGYCPRGPVIYLPANMPHIHNTHRPTMMANQLHYSIKPGVDYSWSAARSLARSYFFSNFGVSTSKQCCSHFLAFSRRPYIRSTLYHCGRVGGGIQQMQTYTSAFEARQVLFFFYKKRSPPIPFPFRLPSLCVRPATKDFQSLGTLVPRIIGLWEWFC